MAFNLGIILSNINELPLDLDSWRSVYSGGEVVSINLASGFNAIAIPDLGVNGSNTTNYRIFVLIPPRSNTQSIELKGVTGDTGLAQNPLGPLVVSFPPSDATLANGIGILAGAAITGCIGIWM